MIFVAFVLGETKECNACFDKCNKKQADPPAKIACGKLCQVTACLERRPEPPADPWITQQYDLLHIVFRETHSTITSKPFPEYASNESMTNDFKHLNCVRLLRTYTFSSCSNISIRCSLIRFNMSLSESTKGTLLFTKVSSMSGTIALDSPLMYSSTTCSGVST